MSYGTRIKGLGAAIKRLESAAGKGRRCARCRLMLRRSWPDPKKPRPRPEDVIKAQCQFCRSEFIIRLAGMLEVEREAFRLTYSFTLEDMYTNPKAHALSMWWQHRPDLNKKDVRPVPPRAKNNPGSCALAKLREEEAKLFARKHKTLRAKYGETPFPQHIELIKTVKDGQRSGRAGGDHVPGLSKLKLAEQNHMVCAEMEKIIWGQTSAETAAALQATGQKIDELLAAARAERERLDEEIRRNSYTRPNQPSSQRPDEETPGNSYSDPNQTSSRHAEPLHGGTADDRLRAIIKQNQRPPEPEQPLGGSPRRPYRDAKQGSNRYRYRS